MVNELAGTLKTKSHLKILCSGKTEVIDPKICMMLLKENKPYLEALIPSILQSIKGAKDLKELILENHEVFSKSAVGFTSEILTELITKSSISSKEELYQLCTLLNTLPLCFPHILKPLLSKPSLSHYKIQTLFTLLFESSSEFISFVCLKLFSNTDLSPYALHLIAYL